MMVISILLSFQLQGGEIAKKTASASVAFFFAVSFTCLPA
jgi:hypothetical protein